MNRREKGILGEAKVLLYFVEKGYEIFLPYSDGTPFDLIITKDNKLYRVSVKYTSRETTTSWAVTLKSVSRRKDNKNLVKNFDNTECDLVAIYSSIEDRILILDAKKITTKTELRVKKENDKCLAIL